jgi:hypothetical protein
MTLHDLRGLDVEAFHSFHLLWLVHLSEAWNRGVGPTGYYSQNQHHTAENPFVHSEPSFGRQRTLALRREADQRLVAVVEVMTARTRATARDLDETIDKLAALLRGGVHVAVIDPLPVSSVTARLALAVGACSSAPQLAKPLTLASFRAGPSIDLYLSDFAIGEPFPVMPLFLTPTEEAR